MLQRYQYQELLHQDQRIYTNFELLPFRLLHGDEVITIGGLYGTVDEVDTENKTIVLDVDGVYLTFELGAIRTVLPVKEAVTPEGAVIEEGSAIEE